MKRTIYIISLLAGSLSAATVTLLVGPAEVPVTTDSAKLWQSFGHYRESFEDTEQVGPFRINVDPEAFATVLHFIETGTLDPLPLQNEV